MHTGQTMETESGAMQPQGKEHPEPPEAGGDEEAPCPADTSASDFQAPGRERVNLCCFEPPGLWRFVAATPGL